MSKNSKEYMAKWREKNRDKTREYSRKHYLANKDKIRRAHRKHYLENKDEYFWRTKRNHLIRKYGISIDEYMEMFKSQGGKCGICQRKVDIRVKLSSENAACVDHSHESNIVRGILCRTCNRNLHIIEDKEFSKKAHQYLAKLMK